MIAAISEDPSSFKVFFYLIYIYILLSRDSRLMFD